MEFFYFAWGWVFIIAPNFDGVGFKIPVGGFLAAGCWILGLRCCLVMSWYYWLDGLDHLPEDRSQVGMQSVAGWISRHRLAVAGLVVAVSMVTGMFQMIDSFRDTIQEWFDVRFQADLYVSESGVTGSGNITE